MLSHERENLRAQILTASLLERVVRIVQGLERPRVYLVQLIIPFRVVARYSLVRECVDCRLQQTSPLLCGELVKDEEGLMCIGA
jgi:hypothetical protein